MRQKLTILLNVMREVKGCLALTFPETPVSAWSVIRHTADFVICHKLYGTNIADYFELRFFEKTPRERKTYFTSKHALRFINCVNGPENNRKFYDKTYMYRVLGRFTKREQLFCPPEDYRTFEDYFRRHGKAFYKPNRTYCGNGIERWDAAGCDLGVLYRRASAQAAVLDEPVVQHPALARIYPDGVNTVKIYTLTIGNECHFVAAEFRMGRDGSFVDNIERGGLAAGVNPETGEILGAAYDLRMNPYPAHPDTGAAISGLTLPNWAEVLRFTKECAMACPLAYVEWDFAIRENDCVLIEANANARNSEIQMGVFHGRKKQFEELEKLYLRSMT